MDSSSQNLKSLWSPLTAQKTAFFVLTTCIAIPAFAQQGLYIGKLEKVTATVSTFCGNERQQSKLDPAPATVVASHNCPTSSVQMTLTYSHPAETPSAEFTTQNGTWLNFAIGISTSASMRATYRSSQSTNRAVTAITVPANDNPRRLVDYGGQCPDLPSTLETFQGSLDKTVSQTSCRRRITWNPSITPAGAPDTISVDTYANAAIVDSGGAGIVIELNAIYRMTPEAPPDLAVTRIKALQVIDGAKYFVPGKSTLVRVYSNSTGDKPGRLGGITGKLTAREFPGQELLPLNNGEAFALPDEINEDELDAGLNFILPEAWTKIPEVNLIAQVALSGNRAEATQQNNTGTYNIKFDSAFDRDLFLVWINVCFDVPDRGQLCPNEGAASLDGVVRYVAPFSENRVYYSHLTTISWPTTLDSPGEFQRMKRVQEIWEKALRKAYKQGDNLKLVMVVPFDAVEADEYYPTTWPIVRDGGSYCGPNGRDPCSGSEAATAFAGRVLVPTASSLDPFPTGAIGFNAGDPSLISSSADQRFGWVANSWMSSSDYNFMADAFKQPSGQAAVPGADPAKPATKAQTPRSAESNDSIIVTGSINPDGSSGALDEAMPFPGLPPTPGDPQGPWCIRLNRASGETADTCFHAVLDRSQPTTFAVDVPSYSDLVRVSLIRRDAPSAELAFLQSGPAPQLAITSPLPGAVWEGKQTIAWSAANPTGQPLTFTLMYSSDGTTWLPLMFGLTQQTYQLDTSTILGGTNVRFRVIASSGLASTYTDIGPVQVRQRPQLVLDTANVEFGSRTLGNVAQQRVLIRNIGTGPAILDAVLPAGSPFQLLGPTSNFIVPAGSSREVTIRYRATEPGSVQNTLSFTGNANAEVRLRGSASAEPVPSIVTPERVDFGRITVNTSRDMPISLRNAGQGTLSITSVAGDSVFQPVSTSLEIARNSSAEAIIRVRPATATTINGRITLRTNDPSRPTVSIDVVVTGTAPAGTPAVSLSPPPPFNFDSTPINTTRTITVTLSNTGAARLSINAAISSNSVFTTPGFSSLSIDPGQSRTVSLAFTPTAANSYSGAITFSTDPVNFLAPWSVSGTGSGTGGAATSSVLSVDKGTFENTIGFPSGGTTAYFINRLTPPSYPATLRSVLVFFPDGELPQGTAVTILNAPNPSGAGGTQLSNLAFQRTAANITSVETFVEFTVPPTTITSGDFLVGFSALNPSGRFPAVVDTVNSKQRSYISMDGITFRLVDSSAAAGNLGIRARVDLGAAPGGTGAPVITVSARSIDFGSTTAGQPSQPRQLVISNTGTAALNATISATTPFSVTPATIPPLAPGGSATVSLAFLPSSATPAQQNGTLLISAPGLAPISVSLTGAVSSNTGGTTGGATGSCPSNTNVAIGKAASQSSNAFGGPAALGINGTLEADYGFHTNEEINPSWQVDLGQIHTVCQVRLFNRVDPAWLDRARSISISASDDGITFRTIYRHDNSVWGAGGAPLVPALAPFTARIVRLRLEASQRLYFHLREVELYGFPGTSGTTGGGVSPGGTPARIIPNVAAAWPNGRTADSVPASAIDGSLTTFTWTTGSSNNVNPSYLGLGFASAATINRIRLYKDNDSGGSGPVAKNLSIEYTTDSPSIPLSQRNWILVTGLANGFQGAELMVAASVSATGAVSGDNHNSALSGWASLTFNPVNATGVRIGFSNATALSINHYRVYEFEVYGSR